VTAEDVGDGAGGGDLAAACHSLPHYGLDLWAECWRRHEATGDMIIVRCRKAWLILHRPYVPSRTGLKSADR
jgi:hypothetical protein